MKVAALLAKLRERDIRIWAEGERLRCNSPPGMLTSELRQELELHKPEVLEFLRSAGSLARQQRAIIPLRTGGTGVPIFAVAGHNGDVFCYRTFVGHLTYDGPFYGLQPPGLDGQSAPMQRVEDLAFYFRSQISAFQPKGPYVIAGYCAGGGVAFELARQLMEHGYTVELLVLLGAPFPTSYRALSQFRRGVKALMLRLVRHTSALVSLSRNELRAYISQRMQQRKTEASAARENAHDPVVMLRGNVERATFSALAGYVPGPYRGPVASFLPSKTWIKSGNQAFRWRSVAPALEEFYGPEGCHTDVMLLEPHVRVFARFFTECLSRMNAGPVDADVRQTVTSNP